MESDRHPLHSICSYLGCFPPSVPATILRKYVPEYSLVLDPFCGSGTTLLEAVRAKRSCIGIDLNPLAVAVATAQATHLSMLIRGRIAGNLREVHATPTLPGHHPCHGKCDAVVNFQLIQVLT